MKQDKKYEKDYSSYYRISDGGTIHFLKPWTNGKDFQDLEKELPIMLKQAHKKQDEYFDNIPHLKGIQKNEK